MSNPVGASLPPNAIQRILHLTQRVHIYAIPPLTSTKGYSASSWTHPTSPTAKQIFTARLRILETAIPNPNSPSGEDVTTEILLEDPGTGDLFAGAPYTSAAVVEPAVDSSRFFAIRVVGEGGRKAVLGMGFEERSEALDFSIALQEVRKVLGMEAGGKTGRVGKESKDSVREAKEVEKRDWSLKEGETITVDIGGRGRRGGAEEGRGKEVVGDGDGDANALFALKPPPGGASGGMPFLPPPPSASDVKAERRRSRGRTPEQEKQARDMGFDDGEFGEFQ
ncbi:MAG: hypothetical protein M1820_000893 [Bogoriella megaspora]|nr:MAG: hypothetical protein M1820_000893 [Bogoriella megaspora]